MIKGGIGGGNTVTGLKFETKAHILTRIKEIPGYSVKDNAIYFQDELLALSYPKHSLYNVFLKEQGIDHTKYFSKLYLPDDAIYVPSQRKIYIIEMKFQTVSGSVDEKLQTCDFKKKIYSKIFNPIGIDVEFIFILNEWWEQARLKDAYDYIESVGCSYYFEVLPFDRLGFPNVQI